MIQTSNKNNENESSDVLLKRRGRKKSKPKNDIDIRNDIEKLNDFCVNSSPWSEKNVHLLLDQSSDDNPVVAGIKKDFQRFYYADDWENLKLWDEERKWFYTYKNKIDLFVKQSSEPKKEMLKLLKFSYEYDDDTRQFFEEEYINKFKPKEKKQRKKSSS